MNSANSRRECAMPENKPTRKPTVLDLPDEALIEIIRYVDFPSRYDVGLVCKTFYEMLCTVERDDRPLKISFSQISDDDEIFDSIMTSSREFNDLTVDLKPCEVLAENNRLEPLVEKFGRRVKKFKLWSPVQLELSEISESRLISIMSCLPNVEEIVLRNIHVSESNTNEDDLNLPKLKSLIVDDCVFSRPLMFNKIPADVLSDLVFSFQPLDPTEYQNFFNRQNKIKKLELFQNYLINFDHLQLEHLKISSDLDFARMLTQQPSLRYIDFAITFINEDVFVELCKLKHLEVVKLSIGQVSCAAFRGMAELVQLKELRMEDFADGHLMELSMMKCLSLEKLTLILLERAISEEQIIALSQNFHKLKHIEIMGISIKIISTILEHFPNLESLFMDLDVHRFTPDDILEVSNDLKHEKLKQLVISKRWDQEFINTLSMLKLVAACPNLERIKLSKLQHFTKGNLQQVLEDHPNLTHLSLEFYDFSLTSDVFSIIRRFGKELVYLRLHGSEDSLRHSFSTMKAITLCEHQFPSITFPEYNGEIVVMKKRNVRDWLLDFDLMHHF